MDMSSYSMFMNLLGKVLRRLVQADGKNQIMKIIGMPTEQFPHLKCKRQKRLSSKLRFISLGRILTKFGESKLFALTEVGIHNLLTLFLILASIIGTEELVSAFQFDF